MNLTMSALGWFHTLCCLYAMWSGGRLLLSPKGGAQHRTRGRRYIAASLLVNVSALGIYTLGSFRVFHWMAIVTLVSIAIAFASAYWKRPYGIWLRIHLTGIIFSYYMLWGGAVNEAFLRIAALKPLAREGVAVGFVHTLFMAMLLMSIAYYWGKTSRPYRAEDATHRGNVQTI